MNRILKKDIIKVFSLTAVSTLVKMFTGFISIKIVASLIGPAGIALLGQLNNFSNIFLTISSGGINTGVTKYIAQYSESRNKIRLFIISAVWIVGIMSILCGFTLIIGSSFFARFILDDEKYSSVLMIFGFTIIFYSFNSLFLSILNGYREFKKFVFVTIISSLIGLLFSSILTFIFGIRGALTAAVTFELVVFVIILLVISKSTLIRQQEFFGKFRRDAGKKLANYSLMALVTAATVPVSQLIIRSSIVKYTSLGDAGLWEAMNRLSSMYLLVITSSLSVYYLPRLSQISADTELRSEIISIYKIILPPLLVFILMIFVMRDAIINFVFNERFIGMERLFGFQLIGDFFKISSWILAYQMVARSMTKYYIVTEILGSILSVTLAMFLIRIYGNIGANIGYAIAYIIYFIVMLVIFRRVLRG
ncbi:O-antigen translocase [Flavihumibacter sp. R14]|nr:O-antigen translocase [Flavihumibacter soli]